MTHHAILSRNHTALVVIDYQEKLVPMLWRSSEIIERARLVIRAAPIYEIPIVITEHYPKGLGRTVPEISDALGDAHPFEKVVFSAFGSNEFSHALKKLEVDTLMVMGIESHICVSQTVHDAIDRGYGVHVISDAISSRSELDHWVGIGKMKEAGAVMTTAETALYEIQNRAGNTEFRELLKLVK